MLQWHLGLYRRRPLPRKALTDSKALTANGGPAVFRDRKDAGERLGRALSDYKGKGVLVLAIPRGGVRVGFEVARSLDCDFSILITRKLPYPTEPEAGFGAIAEDGSTYMAEHAASWLPRKTIETIVAEQQAEITRRIRALRKGKPLPAIEGRTVILVDDGIAGGSTMMASIAMCKHRAAGKIVAAAPVAGPDTAAEIGRMVDDAVILETPPFFRAVAQVYEHWYDVPDREVLEIMEEWENLRSDR
jgi:putative phosphoribosyl transferase